jgi:hypothetical protein
MILLKVVLNTINQPKQAWILEKKTCYIKNKQEMNKDIFSFSGVSRIRDVNDCSLPTY